MRNDPISPPLPAQWPAQRPAGITSLTSRERSHPRFRNVIRVVATIVLGHALVLPAPPTAGAVAASAGQTGSATQPTSAAETGDDPGTADHPLVSRYPGQTIRWSQLENHRPYVVPVGPITGYRMLGEVIETAGRVTRIFYAYEGTDRTHSEIWRNYVDALTVAGFEILGQGAPTTRAGRQDVGGRSWLGVALANNPWSDPDPDLATLTSGTATEGGSAAVIARKERAAGTAYVAVYLDQHSDRFIGTLVDIVEVAAAETGLIVVDAEALGKGLAEAGRVVLDGIVFDFDAARIRTESRPALETIAGYLNANPDRSFYVVGHTDARGSLAYNQQLSRDRARAVVDALVTDHGIARERLEPHGLGPLAPVFANATDRGRERNRRVELVER